MYRITEASWSDYKEPTCGLVATTRRSSSFLSFFLNGLDDGRSGELEQADRRLKRNQAGFLPPRRRPLEALRSRFLRRSGPSKPEATLQLDDLGHA